MFSAAGWSAGLYTHGESNPNRWNRNPLFYPLNYGCFFGPDACAGGARRHDSAAKVINFSETVVIATEKIIIFALR